MNTIDVAIVLLCALVALVGFWRGFLNQTAGIAGAFAGIWIGVEYTSEVARSLHSGYGIPESVAQLIAFAGLFIATYLACRILGWALTWAISASAVVSRVNGILGTAVGGVKGVVFAAAALVVIDSASFIPGAHEAITESMIGSVLVTEGREAAEAIRVYAVEAQRKTGVGDSRPPSAGSEVDAANGEDTAPGPNPSANATMRKAVAEKIGEAVIGSFTDSSPKPNRPAPDDASDG